MALVGIILIQSDIKLALTDCVLNPAMDIGKENDRTQRCIQLCFLQQR